MPRRKRAGSACCLRMMRRVLKREYRGASVEVANVGVSLEWRNVTQENLVVRKCKRYHRTSPTQLATEKDSAYDSTHVPTANDAPPSPASCSSVDGCHFRVYLFYSEFSHNGTLHEELFYYFKYLIRYCFCHQGRYCIAYHRKLWCL